MARTNSDAVKALMLPGGDYDTENNPSLTPFIDTASMLIDQIPACVTRKGGTALTDAQLELLERWLAAHFYQQSDKGYTSRSTAGASGSFGGQVTMHLESTLYGQTALTIDPSGCLANIARNQRAGASWIGKTRSQKLSYSDRNG